MTVLSQPVVMCSNQGRSVSYCGWYLSALPKGGKCSDRKVQSVRYGHPSEPVAIKCKKGFCVHRHIPQPQTTRRQQPSRYGQRGQGVNGVQLKSGLEFG